MRTGAPSVPATAAVRPGWPSLKITIPLAPAAWALVALVPNVHVPRCTSAMLPTGKPAKSAAAHPDIVVPAGVSPIGTFSGPTAVTFAVTSPEPEYCIVAKSVPLTNVCPVGALWLNVDGANSWKYGNTNGCFCTAQPSAVIVEAM
jgi:hypothetical protein